MPATVRLDRRDRTSRWGWPAVAIAAALAVVAPVAVVASSILTPSTDVWRQLWDTRLPAQLRDTVVLLVGVGLGTLVLGVSLAWVTSAYRFPGSRVLGWLLVLPLAMPGYILGFVFLSVLGYAGPVQSWWRDVAGDGAWFPEVRSMGGAIVVLTLVLYPYVYLLSRAALADQAGGAYEAARILGAGPLEAARRVVVPLLRPAIAAGLAVVMMETLTDFATVQYFGIDTVSVGVFRVWRGTFDRDAASELATLVLAFALLVVGLERVLRGRARYGQAAGVAGGIAPRRLGGAKAVAATVACSAVVIAAVGAPVLRLVTWAIDEATGPRGTPLTGRFAEFLQNSVVLAVTVTAVCLVVGFAVVNAGRFDRTRTSRLATRAATVGYAVPGPVVAIGVLLVLVALDRALGAVGVDIPGFVVTGSFIGLVYACSVRYLGPAVATVESGLGQVPEEVTASARSLGARPWRAATTVHLPLARTSIATAAVLVAVDALKELPIVLLLRPFGFDTLSVWVWNLASESRFEQAALPALAIIAAATVPVVLLTRRMARESRHQRVEASPLTGGVESETVT